MITIPISVITIPRRVITMDRYPHPAKPEPEALSVGGLVERALPALDPMLEILLSALARILVIELMAYSTFRWAQEVLADPECSAASRTSRPR